MTRFLSDRTKMKWDMSKIPRRKHAPVFRVKVAFEVLSGEQIIVARVRRHQTCPNQVSVWK